MKHNEMAAEARAWAEFYEERATNGFDVARVHAEQGLQQSAKGDRKNARWCLGQASVYHAVAQSNRRKADEYRWRAGYHDLGIDPPRIAKGAR